jgi:tRNA (cytidine/uridine-2'-O-)-methyltransferase
MRIALYQPDIAANAGTIIRLGACMGVAVDIIEPCGFPFGAAAMRRAGLDYLPRATVIRHAGWKAFRSCVPGRVILATTRAEASYTQWRYQADDTLLLGSETAGVPPEVASAANGAVKIPMETGMRSLNVAVSAAMILGEMLRQTRWTIRNGRDAE